MRVILSGTVFAVYVSVGLMALSVGTALPVQAQSVAQVGGPAELPPAGFTGQQFVDSRGCVFMRAGFSGRISWVPSIGRDRKPICNEVTPAEASARLAQGDTSGAVASAGRPLATVASEMSAGRKTGVFAPIPVPGLYGSNVARNVGQSAAQYAPQPRIVAAQPSYSQSNTTASAGSNRSTGCPAIAPVLQTLPLNNGGTVMVCTRGDGTATGWVSPRFGAGARPGAAIRDNAAQQQGGGFGAAPAAYGQGAAGGSGAGGSGSGGYVQAVIGGQPVVAPRRAGQTYVAAWPDDRLNPNRGLGTRQGWANQAQVWTLKVPARTLVDVAQQQARRSADLGNAGKRLTASTMSADGQASPSAGARIYVQVGTFAQAANAKTAAGRLFGVGLPVASSKGVQGGRQLVSILAGPFGSVAEANQALGMARSVGFADAFIR